MAKEESKKSKAAAKAAAGPDARAVVVASVASFHEAAGFPRAFAALQSEARLEEGTWKSAAVGLEDLVSKFLESSGSAPVTATVGNTEPDEAGNDASVPSAVLEDQAGEKKKKKKKGDTEASEPESKVTEPSAEETPPENVGAETKEKKRKKKKDGSSTEEDKETVKGDHQKVGGKKKKSQKQEVDGDVEARLDKASLAIQNKLEAAEELKEDEGDGATDKTKKKKNGKSEKIVGSVAAEGDDSAKAQTDGDGTVIDDNGKKAKKKRKKSGSEENVPEEGKDHRQGKSAMELEDDEEVKPSSENAAVGKTRKLEAVEESKTPAAENGTTNQTLSNGFAEDDSKENGTMSKPSKRQKTSAEPKSVTPFQRVKMEAVKFADERLQDNSYWAKGGAEIGYGAKAQEVLGQVRGRGFRHEKTKKKRGTYRGGQIDLGTHSIKFENSDDE